MVLPLHAYTTLARLVNRIIDSGPETNLPYREIFDAAYERRLIPLLLANYGHIADFTWVTAPHAADLPQMEAALRDAAAAFEGRMGTATSSQSGLCLVIEIILQAIQTASCAESPAPPGLRNVGHLLFALCHSGRRIFQRISTYFKGFQRISNQNL